MSLKKLQLDYVDLYLIHLPVTLEVSHSRSFVKCFAIPFESTFSLVPRIFFLEQAGSVASCIEYTSITKIYHNFVRNGTPCILYFVSSRNAVSRKNSCSNGN